MSLVAGVRTLTSTPSRAVAISDWVRIGRERKRSVTHRRSCTPAVRNSSILKVRILRGSWTTRRALVSPAASISFGSGRSSSGNFSTNSPHSLVKARFTSATTGPLTLRAVSR